MKYLFVLIFSIVNTVHAKEYDGILNLYLYPQCEGEKAVDFSVCAVREEIAQNLIYQNNIYTIFDSKFNYPAGKNLDNFSYEKSFNFICNANENLKRTLQKNKYIRLRVENPDDPFFKVVFRLKYDPKKVVETFEKNKDSICSLKKQMQVEVYRQEQEELRRQKQEWVSSQRVSIDHERKEKQKEIVMFLVWGGFILFVLWFLMVLLKRIKSFSTDKIKKITEKAQK